MKNLLRFINRISSDIDLMKSNSYNDADLNDMLYRYISAQHKLSSFDTGKQILVLNPIEESIEVSYSKCTHPMMTNDVLTHTTKKLTLQIARQIDITSSKLTKDETQTIHTGLLGYLLHYKSPIITRERYNKHRYDQKARDLDIESLLKIAYITQRSDLDFINAPELKKDLLNYYIKDAIFTILYGTYNKLASIGLVKPIKQKYDMSIKSYTRIILVSCANHELEEFSDEAPDESAKKDLIKHCRKYPDTSESLISFLNELREKLSIYPSTCDKKTFGTLAYILYKGQESIGLRKEAYTTFNKFKNVLARYYGMPTSEFKPKNVDQKTLDKLYRFPVLNKVKEDAKWKE